MATAGGRTMASLSGVRAWDETADVVVVGFGLSGAISAIEAYDTDPAADILIVEKMPEQWAGGNARASGQDMFSANDVDGLMQHQQALNQPNPVPEDVLRTWAEAVCSQEPWIAKMAKEAGRELLAGGDWGRNHVEWPEEPGAQAITYLMTIVPHPSGVWETFKFHAYQRPIRKMFEAPVVDLVQDPDTAEIFGVIVEQRGQRRAIRVRRAVILCCGSFENNLDMLRNYWGIDKVYSYGTPGNTGDGVRMLQKAGADLWHLRGKSHAAGFWPGFKVPEHPTPFMRNIRHPGMTWFEVAKDGRRFHNETSKLALERHWRRPFHGLWLDGLHKDVQPVHMIFDEKHRLGGSLALQEGMTWNAVVARHPWSADNAAELRKGWFFRADTLADLAGRIGVAGDVLQATAERYNASCRTGFDLDHGRDRRTLEAVEGPPFYAIEVIVGLPQAVAGAKRNKHAQVLDHKGAPIPRLYEAGELGSTMVGRIQTGAFLTECVVFGRIAGRAAVGERPWAN
ncbi:MAG: FAD-binding protein [Alphaproteobacteria bacterium]|nr:FAD-binding protein [Alphaproteobacteria bacterium]